MKRMLFVFNALLLMLLLGSCKLDGTADIYPSSGSAPNPEVISVLPDSAFNGVTDIRLIGNNFGSRLAETFVYFGKRPAKVLSVSNNEITARRPIDVSGSVIIRVANQDALQSGKFEPFKMENGFFKVTSGVAYNSFTVGKNDTIFAESGRTVYKISPSGEVTEFGDIILFSSEMRVGADGALFIQSVDNRNFYRIPPEGGDGDLFNRIKVRANVFDLDDQGYIYSGGVGRGLSITLPDGSDSQEYESDYDQFGIYAIRIYDGYMYVAADTLIDEDDDQEPFYRSIFRHQLIGDGVLGERELFFDYTNQAGQYSESAIKDLTFNSDGELYIAIDDTDPIIVLTADGILEPLYSGSISANISQIAWGTGNYLFINSVPDDEEDSEILRVIMGKGGAPYYGRD